MSEVPLYSTHVVSHSRLFFFGVEPPRILVFMGRCFRVQGYLTYKKTQTPRPLP